MTKIPLKVLRDEENVAFKAAIKYQHNFRIDFPHAYSGAHVISIQCTD